MSYNIKSKYLFIAILIAIAGIFIGGWVVGSNKALNALKTTIKAQKEEILQLTVQINDTEYQLTKSEQVVASQRELIKQGEIDRATLKAINIKKADEIIKLKLRIDTLLEDVSHNGTIITVDTVFVGDSSQKALLLPFTFVKTDKWLDLRGDFNSSGKLNTSIKMTADVDVISGIDRKSKQRTVSILTDNPYLQTVGVRSFKIEERKPSKYGIGVQVGWGVTKENLSPYVGIGLNYNVIRF